MPRYHIITPSLHVDSLNGMKGYELCARLMHVSLTNHTTAK